MARKANAAGAGYDYLIIFNIYSINEQYRAKLFGTTQLQDVCISVKAMDVQSGEYIARHEYLHRGRTTAGPYASISNRRSMRRAIINAMIECFDNMPIGKYSVCDNPYCERRQDELRSEDTFGKVNRHCVKHCHDNTNCSDHMVDYAKDADLPYSYVNHHHKVD